MSNYPNMSYCMYANTREAMNQVIEALVDGGKTHVENLSREEIRAYRELYYLCKDFIDLAEEIED